MLGVGRADGAEKSKRQKSDKISGEPVGLSKGGEDTVLNILNPDIFIDAKVFENGIQRGDNSRGENGGEKVFDGFGFAGKVGD